MEAVKGMMGTAYRQLSCEVLPHPPAAEISVVDPNHLDAYPDANLDSTYHPDADLAAYPDSDFFYLMRSGCGYGSGSRS